MYPKKTKPRDVGNMLNAEFPGDEFGAAMQQVATDFDRRLSSLSDDIVTVNERIKRGPFIHARTSRLLPPGVLPDDVFSCDEFAANFADAFIGLRKEPPGTKLRVCALDPTMDTTGGETIREEMSLEIVEHLERVGDIYRDAGKMPLGAVRRTIPRVTNDVEFSFVVPGQDAAEDDPTFGSIVMQAEEAAGYLELPNSMLDDAVPGLGNFIALRMLRGVTRFRENMLVNGNGSPAHGGIIGLLNSDNVTVVNMAAGADTFAEADLDDLISLEEFALDDGEDNEAAYYFSRGILANFKRIKESTGGYIWSPASGPTPAMINGHRYVTSPRFPKNAASAVSTKFIVFGNLRNGLLVGDRMDVSVEVSRDFQFRKRMTCYLVSIRFDAVVVPGSVAGENPLTALKTAAA